MRRLRKRQQWWHQPILRRATIVVLLVMLTGFVRGIVTVSNSQQLATSNRAEIQLELDKLEEQKKELQLEIDRLATPEGKETELRSKFNVIREGEKVIILKDDPRFKDWEPEPEEIIPAWKFWKK